MYTLLPSLLFTAQFESAARPGMFDIIRDVGPVGWIVAGILVSMSLASWAIMLGKFFHFRRATAQTREFLEVFRRSQRFSEVASVTDDLDASPLVGLFRAGHVEIDSQVKHSRQADATGTAGFRIRSLEALDRTLRRAINLEVTVLGKGTSFLATTAAASPFIGLFGTVWGIMVAFQEIALSGSTSLVAVAPGIAEALINTALGLAAAIPALMGYNYFSNRIRQVRSEMTDFSLEFINLAERIFT